MKTLYKVIDGGYISAIGTNGNDNVIEINESEYTGIMQKINNKPTDPDGYAYKLQADNLEWVLVETETLMSEEIATETDYEDALRMVGVNI